MTQLGGTVPAVWKKLKNYNRQESGELAAKIIVGLMLQNSSLLNQMASIKGGY